MWGWGPRGFRRMWRGSAMAFPRCHCRLALEERIVVRHLPCHQEIEDRANTVEVTLLGVVALQRLGSVVACRAIGRAASVRTHRTPLGIGMVEVYQHHLLDSARGAFRVLVHLHHEIVGLDVSMEHTLLMHKAHGLQDVPHQVLDGAVRHHAIIKLCEQALKQGPAQGTVHQYVVEVVVLEDLPHGHDANVRRQVEHALLGLEERFLMALVAE
mmetsp:Transcript_41301/g.87967  ORF Transcript_41301/g.87967 Transcript_41301/m.87967 type:complete len:213 (+) Transcript_41301:226-864(+)